ncbi:MAG: hypothetical protein ACI4PF_04755 [Christensenellales bacterium]
MLEFYNIQYTTFLNGVKIGKYSATRLCDEKEENTIDNSINLNWVNMEDYYKEMAIVLPFSVYKFKKGMVLDFYTKFCTVKEWKNKILDLKVEITHNKINYSIQQVLEWHNMEQAIQYLNERGLNVVQ